MLQSVIDWLTPARRKAIYNVGVAVFALVIVAGWVAPDQIEKFQTAFITAGGVFAVLTNLLASKNVNQ
jgi:hypothetical protein